MVGLEDLQTGDLILFDTKPKPTEWFSYVFDNLIKIFTQSQYTHCGVILKNPTFVDLPPGTYIWECGIEKTLDPQDYKKKFGVQICNLETYKASWKYETVPFVRRWSLNSFDRAELFSDTNLIEIHNKVYNKPYDININDWIDGLLKLHRVQTTKRFWCSAFVGYIYMKLKLLHTADFSMLSPSDLSDKSKALVYYYKLCNDELLDW